MPTRRTHIGHKLLAVLAALGLVAALVKAVF